MPASSEGRAATVATRASGTSDAAPLRVEEGLKRHNANRPPPNPKDQPNARPLSGTKKDLPNGGESPPGTPAPRKTPETLTPP